MIEDPEIDLLRHRIDGIDQQLLELLCERLKVVHLVGEEKRAKGLPVFDPKREEMLLQRLVKEAPSQLDEHAVRAIFSAIIGESRRLETAAVTGETERPAR